MKCLDFIFVWITQKIQTFGFLADTIAGRLPENRVRLFPAVYFFAGISCVRRKAGKFLRGLYRQILS
jgi:hypothetical protein